jgi:hypothetical protein
VVSVTSFNLLAPQVRLELTTLRLAEEQVECFRVSLNTIKWFNLTGLHGLFALDDIQCNCVIFDAKFGSYATIHATFYLRWTVLKETTSRNLRYNGRFDFNATRRVDTKKR